MTKNKKENIDVIYEQPLCSHQDVWLHFWRTVNSPERDVLTFWFIAFHIVPDI